MTPTTPPTSASALAEALKRDIRSSETNASWCLHLCAQVDALAALKSAPAAVEAKRVPLTEGDVYTLIGHAHTIDGEDMPRYLLELASRLAEAMGDEPMRRRCLALRDAHGIGSTDSGEGGAV